MNDPKGFKHDFTLFEQLPNELFIEIFLHLNGVDTVYAFSQLNNRFQSLLISYVTIFDFQSTSKAKFDYITQHYDIRQWRSLRLSEDDETPGQIRLFCRRYPPQRYISQLQSFGALNMTPKYAQELIPQLVSFDHLVSLEIGNVCGKSIRPLELPSLKRLVITACKHSHWIMNFHSLESLEYIVTYKCHDQYALSFPTTLKHLKLFYSETKDGNSMRALLRQMSQLTKLALYDMGSGYRLANGRTWEELIQSSLPLLKTFQFCFPFHQYDNMYISNPVKEAMASFSTPFYLLEKRWFVRCSLEYGFYTTGTLYSLPFAFAEMPINVSSFDTSISTLPVSVIHDKKYKSYEKVKTLVFRTRPSSLHREIRTSSIVQSLLNTSLPTDYISLLANLHHLVIKGTRFASSTDFARLLANTFQLRSLAILATELETLTNNFTNSAVCYHLSQRIKSLTLTAVGENIICPEIVNARLLSPIDRIFGEKCEYLSLSLEVSLNTVLPILQRMKQLRSLHIRCAPRYNTLGKTVTYWLQEQLTGPAKVDFVHSTGKHDYFVWFGNRP